MDEILATMIQLHQSYEDVLLMPTIERRHFLLRLKEEKDKFDEQQKNQTKYKSKGKGRRSYSKTSF